VVRPITGELVLRNGRVIDPANGRDEVLDIRVVDGRVAAIDRNLPEQPGDRSIDVGGFVVTPGIIDMHAHVAISHIRSELSLHPFVNTIESGVTTVVDAGTTGWRDFSDFRHDVIENPRVTAKIRVLSFVNIVGSGMGGGGFGGAWEHEAAEMNPRLAANTAVAHADVVVGIKTAHYWAKRRFDEAHPAWLAVDRALEAANLCEMPLMVDFFPNLPTQTYPDLILEKMRPGDIHTHVFAQQFPTVQEDGKVFDYMWQARERGIIFDLGHGAGSFWYRHAVPAIKDGFIPDSISTDLHTGNVAGVVIDMQTCMNKILNIGVPLPQVIEMSTVAPARELRRPELGTLSIGSPADIAVFTLEEGAFTYVDCEQTTLTGNQRLRCDLTVYNGNIVYNPDGMGLVSWEQDAEEYPVPFHVRAQDF
jgi:dihydroorotase